MRPPLLLTLVVLLAVLVSGGARAETYRVSPEATAETKAAVAEGRPPLHGFPEILDVHYAGSRQLRPGLVINADVETSDNVTYVEARIRYWNVALRPAGPGRFTLTYYVPMLPPSAVGHWNLEVVARTLDGVEVRRSIPVSYDYL